MGFDLDAYEESVLDVADITITDPKTLEPTQIVITVMGVDSDEYRKALLRLRNEQLKYARKNGGKTSAEKLQQESIDLLVAATVGWRGLDKKGQEWPFSPDNARELYRKYPFIREQVDEFIGERRNFIRD